MEYNFLSVYCKLTRMAVLTDRSRMDPQTHRDFMTFIDRAQQIVNLEAQQFGLPDLSRLPSVSA